MALLLTLWAVATVPMAAQDIGWAPGMERLTTVALVAVLFGLLLARFPFGGYLSALFAVIVGVEFVVGFIGRVAPPMGVMLHEVIYAARWLYALEQGVVGRVPFLPVLEIAWERAWDFWLRLSVWAQGVSQGGAQQDNLLFLVFSGLAIWGMGVWAGWWVFRRRQGLIALLPAGFGLATNIFFAREGESWTVSFMAALLLLLVSLRRYTLEELWSRLGLDYSEELRWGLYTTGVFVSAAILILMPIVPNLSSQRISELFWDLFASPWREVEESAERMFPELERPAVSPLPVGLGGSPDRMPRAHLLGGSPELGRRVALRVRLNQPPPQYGGQKYYYRAVTYADYSGHGWSNEGDVEKISMPPGEPWDASLESSIGRKRLLQGIEIVEAPGFVLYAAGEPVAPDIPYLARVRAPGDLISLIPEKRPRRYSIVSAVPAVSEDQLREADRTYPEAIRARYLSLPDGIPQRVLDLAAEIVAGIENPYDQAVAIESFLRQYEYTLDVDPPPPDRDVVDYFLFDLKKGYCDYYASAMVVMARAVGIPARLAVGYASGGYDEHMDEYTITEAEAHSWPELYFPPYGWIPFEPTASRSPFERIGLPDLPEVRSGGAAEQELPELSWWNPWPRRWGLYLAVFGGALAALALGYLAWRRYQEMRLGPVATAYAGLLWWGRRLGEPHRPAETPHEHAYGLARHMKGLAERARRWRARWHRWEGAVLSDLLVIADAYAEEIYARRSVPDARRRQVRASWRRLRGKFLAFWLFRRW